ncbi:hypothetical protein T4C_5784 [Trichinella pseudospiralis]|uniref:Uncharacterized protein n=1 Tax=Trichinella pseudospiralis TaxID=6337 RepID=A0A0V1JEX8_TRIPS|nr:hypothetical protein T4C_5784 [Trichinella pseudospiralis]
MLKIFTSKLFCCSMLYTALTTTLSVTRIEAAASRNCHCTKAAKIYSCQQPPLLMLSKLRSISIDGSTSNRTVRVVGFVNPPFLLNCFTSYPDGCNNPGPGLDAEYIYVVLHYLMDYNVQWIRVKDRNAMFNALESGAADFTGVGTPLIEEYFGKFKNTPVYLFDAIALVVKSRSASSAADFHAVAFVETDVWFLFTITVLSIYMLSHLSKYIYEVYAFEQDFNRRDRLITFLRSFRETIIYTFAFISVIFFLNLVSNIITVYLVKKDERIEYGFDNLNELGRLLLRKKCRFTMLSSTKDDPIFHHLMINPKVEDEIPWTNLFRKAFVKNPPLYVDSRYDMGKLITKSLCYIGVDLYSLKEFYESRFCFVKVISMVKETSQLQSVFYYREDALASKLSVMSMNTLRMFYAGRATVYSRPNRTVFCATDYFELKPLEIGKIQDFFYFLIFTTLVAFLILGLEKIYCKLMWENSTVTAQSISDEKIVSLNQSQSKKAPIIKTIISEGKQKWNRRVIDFLKPNKKIHITQAVPVADVSGNGETIAAEFKEVPKMVDCTTAKIDLPLSAAVIEQEQENPTTQQTVHDVTTDDDQSAGSCDNCWTVRYGTLAIVVLEASALVSWFVLHILYSTNTDAFSISWRGVVALLLLTVIAMVVFGVLTNRAWLLWPHIAVQMAGICTGMVLTLSTVLVMSVGSEASDYLFAKLFSPESVPWFEKMLGPIWPFCLAVIFNFVTALGLWFYTVNKRCQMHLRAKQKGTQVGFLKFVELLKCKGSQLASAGQAKA